MWHTSQITSVSCTPSGLAMSWKQHQSTYLFWLRNHNPLGTMDKQWMVTGQLERSTKCLLIKQGLVLGSRKISVSTTWFSVWSIIDNGRAHSKSCFCVSKAPAYFKGHRFQYVIDSTQLQAISLMAFPFYFARWTLPFHIISWHFHPGAGNVFNFILTHQCR